MSTVAVLGTGIMGAAMARNLVRSGFEVHAWNRTPDKLDSLVDEGVKPCDSPRDAARGADFVITMVFDADAVEGCVRDGALAGTGATWLQMSTVGVEGARRLASIAEEQGVVYVDSPVLGTRKPAERGELLVLASGPEDCRDRCRPVFDAVGKQTLWLGPAGNGSRLKLVMNSWVLALVTGTAEAMALAAGLGLDPKRFLDTISGGALDVPYAHLKGEAMIKAEFPPAFPLSGAVKDAGLITAAASSAGVRAYVAEGAERALRAAADAGHGDEDVAAVWHAVAGRRDEPAA